MWVRRSEISGKLFSLSLARSGTTTFFYTKFLFIFGALSRASSSTLGKRICTVISLTAITGRTVININGYKLTIPHDDDATMGSVATLNAPHDANIIKNSFLCVNFMQIVRWC